eukprot:COSAG06_NODE_1555_length_9116_cov_37.620273_7_plen_77_part_00
MLCCIVLYGAMPSDSSIWDVQSVHQVGVTGWSMQQRGAYHYQYQYEREYVNVNVAEPYQAYWCITIISQETPSRSK